MGAITIVAVYQAFLKYPDYGTKLLSLTHNQTAYHYLFPTSYYTSIPSIFWLKIREFVTKVMSQTLLTFFFFVFP